MKLLFAPDSFKGSLSARRITELLEREARRAFPDCETAALPMADGGEGTMEILTDICRGRTVPVTVHGPLNERRESSYAILEDGSALIEMAAASGLPMVPPERRDPERTTTYGTGELIAAALDAGCRRLVIGVGGSATNDGGMGAAAALGVRFLDEDGRELPPVGGSLGRIARIDCAGLHPAAREARFTVMCDVDVPLVGPKGATYMFGPQKGGRPEQLARLEAGMEHYCAVLARDVGQDPAHLSGGGAAGGLAAGLMVFLGARLCSGIETVLELSRFEERLDGVDLVITGEGRVDGQSAHGKVLYGVGTACLRRGVPAIAIAGSLGQGAEEVAACGIQAAYPIVDRPMDIGYAITHAEELFSSAAARVFRALKLGTELGRGR